jgi:hypothetical protein
VGGEGLDPALIAAYLNPAKLLNSAVTL